jgi:hypothetical protein
MFHLPEGDQALPDPLLFPDSGCRTGPVERVCRGAQKAPMENLRLAASFSCSWDITCKATGMEKSTAVADASLYSVHLH